MILVRADDVGEVVVLRAEPLKFWQELQARIADREMHEARPVSNPRRHRRTRGRCEAGRRGENREVAATAAPAYHPDLALGEHPGVPDPACLAFEAGEYLACPRCVVVSPDRFHE